MTYSHRLATSTAIALLFALVSQRAVAQDFILLGSELDDALLFGSPTDPAPGVCNFTPATTEASRVAGLADGKIAVLTTNERVVVCDGPGDLSFDILDLATLVPGVNAEDLCGMSDGRIALLTAANEVLILSRPPGGFALDKIVNVTQIVPNTNPVHVACLANGRFAVSTANVEIIAFRGPDDTSPVFIAANACRAGSGQDLAGLTDGRIALLNTNWPTSLYTVTIFDMDSPSTCPDELPLSRCAIDTTFHQDNLLTAIRDNGLLMFHPWTEEFCVLRSSTDPDPLEPAIAESLPNFTATHIGGFSFGGALSMTTTTSTTTSSPVETTTSTILTGPCSGVGPCPIILPCDVTSGVGPCVVPVPETSQTVVVTVVDLPNSSCRVVLVKLGKKVRQGRTSNAAGRLAVSSLETLTSRAKSEFAKNAKRKLRLTKIVEGTIDAAGSVEVPLQLNAVGTKLLRPKKNGTPREVDARVLVEVTSPDGQPRLLQRLIKLVR